MKIYYSKAKRAACLVCSALTLVWIVVLLIWVERGVFPIPDEPGYAGVLGVTVLVLWSCLPAAVCWGTEWQYLYHIKIDGKKVSSCNIVGHVQCVVQLDQPFYYTRLMAVNHAPGANYIVLSHKPIDREKLYTKGIRGQTVWCYSTGWVIVMPYNEKTIPLLDLSNGIQI